MSGSKAIYLAHPSIKRQKGYKTVARQSHEAVATVHEDFLDHDPFTSPDPDGGDLTCCNPLVHTDVYVD